MRGSTSWACGVCFAIEFVASCSQVVHASTPIRAQNKCSYENVVLLLRTPVVYAMILLNGTTPVMFCGGTTRKEITTKQSKLNASTWKRQSRTWQLFRDHCFHQEYTPNIMHEQVNAKCAHLGLSRFQRPPNRTGKPLDTDKNGNPNTILNTSSLLHGLNGTRSRLVRLVWQEQASQ